MQAVQKDVATRARGDSQGYAHGQGPFASRGPIHIADSMTNSAGMSCQLPSPSPRTLNEAARALCSAQLMHNPFPGPETIRSPTTSRHLKTVRQTIFVKLCLAHIRPNCSRTSEGEHADEDEVGASGASVPLPHWKKAGSMGEGTSTAMEAS